MDVADVAKTTDKQDVISSKSNQTTGYDITGFNVCISSIFLTSNKSDILYSDYTHCFAAMVLSVFTNQSLAV